MSSGGPNILYLRGQFFPRRLLIPGPSFPETLANPNIWVCSGGLPKFRQFLIFCFQSAVLLPGLDMRKPRQNHAIRTPTESKYNKQSMISKATLQRMMNR